MLGENAGHPLNLAKVDAEAFLAAMIAGFHGDERLLVSQLLVLTKR